MRQRTDQEELWKFTDEEMETAINTDLPDLLEHLGYHLKRQGLSAPMRFCSFSANRKCRKMAGKGVQPLNNYTCRFRPSSLKQADKSGLDGLQTGK